MRGRENAHLAKQYPGKVVYEVFGLFEGELANILLDIIESRTLHQTLF